MTESSPSLTSSDLENSESKEILYVSVSGITVFKNGNIIIPESATLKVKLGRSAWFNTKTGEVIPLS